jgi:hypothetical protein
LGRCKAYSTIESVSDDGEDEEDIIGRDRRIVFCFVDEFLCGLDFSSDDFNGC